MRTGKLTRLVYVITPIVLLVTFSTYYGRFNEQQAIEEAHRLAIQKEEEEKANRAQAEMEARLEAEAQMIADAKAKALAEREEAERLDRERRFADVRARLEAASADLAQLTKNVSELTEKVEETRAKRVAVEDDTFRAATELEQTRARKSVEELESQRLMGIIMDRFAQEWAARLTTPVATTPTRR